MIQINLLQDKVFEEMPETQVRSAIGFEHVQAERLEQQSAVKHITRSHVVGMTLNRVWPWLEQFDADRHRLFVPQNVDLNRIAFELALHDFLELRAFAIQLYVRIACDRMTLN